MNAPKLRFRDDDGYEFPSWEATTLGAVAKIVGGGTPDTAIEDYWQGSIQWFTPTELKSKYVSRSKRTITDAGLKNSSAKILPAGTLLLSSRATVGDVSIALNECTTNQGFQSLIVNDKNVNEFIYYWLTNNKKSLLERASGSTFLEISKREIEKLVIQSPVKKEQTKIANFLTAVDEKITQLTQKSALLAQYKKGVMQKIFSQELRFKDDDGQEFPDWEEKLLGNLCTITTGKLDANAMVPDGIYRFYTCAREYYQIDKYAFDTDALLISGNGANVGYIHHYHGKFNAYQRTYVLDKFNDNIIFIKYFLEEFLHQRIYREAKEGNTPYIVMGTLSDMEIQLPTLQEQAKIANLLTAIDDKITQTQAELDAVTQYKQGLLQQMFV